MQKDYWETKSSEVDNITLSFDGILTTFATAEMRFDINVDFQRNLKVLVINTKCFFA